MNISILQHKESILFHHTAQESFLDAYNRWDTDDSCDIWQELYSLRMEMGEFPTVLLLSYCMQKKLCTLSLERLRSSWARCKKNIANALDVDVFSTEEIAFVQAIFRNALIWAMPLEEEPSYSRAASILDLPMQEKDIDEVQQFLREKRDTFLQKTGKNVLEILISTELQYKRPTHSSLLLPLFSQLKDMDTPSVLRDVHSAQAFAACWARLEEELEQARVIQKYLHKVEFTSQWSFGDMRSHYAVVYVQKEEKNADFSWGHRHVRIFEELLPALEWLWKAHPKSSLVIHQHCSYPNAPQCSSVELKEGVCVDNESLVGYSSGERIFLDGGFWSAQGVLEKDKTEEEEQKQREAKEELARLLLDSEDLSLD